MMQKTWMTWLSTALVVGLSACDAGDVGADTGAPQDAAGAQDGALDAAPDAAPDVAPPQDASVPDAGPPDVATHCTGATTCGDCAAMQGCGWCADLGRCFDGTSSGPNGGQCGGPTWDWLSGSCPSPQATCATVTDCASCTGMGACGWCKNIGRCFGGNSSGATGGECSGADWAYLSSSCPGR